MLMFTASIFVKVLFEMNIIISNEPNFYRSVNYIELLAKFT